ncbi:hypothetical protein BDZ85DRAFT_283931 [Elsinoe ampelina]|uniref:Uncharacterized protein n=1 Tax=Elsinoe ampelina TaxID=302913 RepID=A0A6A6G5L2_9PEZI|nr:hypothetical protein BDZ85DRAFT_283931 [Elsinoe ampelina]
MAPVQTAADAPSSKSRRNQNKVGTNYDTKSTKAGHMAALRRQIENGLKQKILPRPAVLPTTQPAPPMAFPLAQPLATQPVFIPPHSFLPPLAPPFPPNPTPPYPLPPTPQVPLLSAPLYTPSGPNTPPAPMSRRDSGVVVSPQKELPDPGMLYFLNFQAEVNNGMYGPDHQGGNNLVIPNQGSPPVMDNNLVGSSQGPPAMDNNLVVPTQGQRPEFDNNLVGSSQGLPAWDQGLPARDDTLVGPTDGLLPAFDNDLVVPPGQTTTGNDQQEQGAIIFNDPFMGA